MTEAVTLHNLFLAIDARARQNQRAGDRQPELTSQLRDVLTDVGPPDVPTYPPTQP